MRREEITEWPAFLVRFMRRRGILVVRSATMIGVAEDTNGAVEEYFEVGETNNDYGAREFGCRPDTCVMYLLGDGSLR